MRTLGIDGTGECGSNVAAGPDAHPDAAASPNWNPNTVIGEATDSRARSVVVDVTQLPAIQGTPVLESFEISTAYLGDVEHSFQLISNANFG